MRTAVSRSRRTSEAPREEIFRFFVCHRLPPVWIKDLNLAFQSSQGTFFASRFLGAHDVDHRHPPAANSHRLSVFDRLNQLRQFVLSVGYADLHGTRIAIYNSYVKREPCRADTPVRRL